MFFQATYFGGKFTNQVIQIGNKLFDAEGIQKPDITKLGPFRFSKDIPCLGEYEIEFKKTIKISEEKYNEILGINGEEKV